MAEEQLNLVCEALEDPVVQAEVILKAAFLERVRFSSPRDLEASLERAARTGEAIYASLSLSKPSSTRGVALRLGKALLVCVGGSPTELEELCGGGCEGTAAIYSVGREELAKILERSRPEAPKALEAIAAAPPRRRGAAAPTAPPSRPSTPRPVQVTVQRRVEEVAEEVERAAPQAARVEAVEVRPAPAAEEARRAAPPPPRRMRISEVPLSQVVEVVKDAVRRSLGVELELDVAVSRRALTVRVPRNTPIGLRVVASALADVFALFEDVERVFVETRGGGFLRRRRESLTRDRAEAYRVLSRVAKVAMERGYRVVDGSVRVGRNNALDVSLHIGVEVQGLDEEYVSRFVLLSRISRDEMRRFAEELARKALEAWKGPVRVSLSVSAVLRDGTVTSPLFVEEGRAG